MTAVDDPRRPLPSAALDWVDRAATWFAALRRLPGPGEAPPLPEDLPDGVGRDGEGAWVLRDGLGTEGPLGIGSRVVFHRTIHSTNARLRALAESQDTGTESRPDLTATAAPDTIRIVDIEVEGLTKGWPMPDVGGN